MAYDSSELTLISHVNGYGLYRYDTLDIHSDVDTNTYFTGEALDMLKTGDFIDVIVWSTALRTGTISTYGRHIVMDSNGTTADVSTVTVGVVTDSD